MSQLRYLFAIVTLGLLLLTPLILGSRSHVEMTAFEALVRKVDSIESRELKLAQKSRAKSSIGLRD